MICLGWINFRFLWLRALIFNSFWSWIAIKRKYLFHFAIQIIYIQICIYFPLNMCLIFFCFSEYRSTAKTCKYLHTYVLLCVISHCSSLRFSNCNISLYILFNNLSNKFVWGNLMYFFWFCSCFCSNVY